MPRLYLDSSAIVKRYVVEPGTEVVDEVFERAEAREVFVVFSVWNVGEVLGSSTRGVGRHGWRRGHSRGPWRNSPTR